MNKLMSFSKKERKYEIIFGNYKVWQAFKF